MNNKTEKSPFKVALVANIKATIKTEKANGTTAMGLETLYRTTPSPSHSLAGAPLGTNAAYYYKEMFVEVARKIAGNFVIGGVA